MKVLKHTGVYFSFNILAALIPIVAMPYLTRNLTPYDYGVFASFAFIITMISDVLRMEQNTYIKKIFVECKEDTGEVISTAFVSSLILHVSSIFFIGIVSLFYDFTYEGINLYWLFAILVISFFRGQSMNLHHLWQIENQSTKYGVWSLISVALNFVIVIGILHFLFKGWEVRALSELLVATFIFCYSVTILYRKYGLRFSIKKDILRKLLRFSLPLLPSTMITSWFFFSDRIFISALDSIASLGIYSVALQLAMSIDLLFRSVTPVWESYVFNLLNSNTADKIKPLLSRLTLFLLFALVVAVVVPFVLGLFLPYFVGKDFQPASELLFPCSASVAALGLFVLTKSPLVFLNKGHFISFTYFTIAVINALLMWVLIGEFGVVGAPISLVITFLLGACAQVVYIFYLLKVHSKEVK